MKLHIIPRIFENETNLTIGLVDVCIPELNLTLKNGEDIVARHPYPNKRYHVACRKVGKKAIRGILIESPTFLENFTVITRWVVNGEVATHECRYKVLDNEHNLVSDEMIIWCGINDGHNVFENRCPKSMTIAPPIFMAARMDAVAMEEHEIQKIKTIMCDSTTPDGKRHRTQVIEIPTIEEGRLHSVVTDGRSPLLEDVFVCEQQS